MTLDRGALKNARLAAYNTCALTELAHSQAMTFHAITTQLVLKTERLGIMPPMSESTYAAAVAAGCLTILIAVAVSCALAIPAPTTQTTVPVAAPPPAAQNATCQWSGVVYGLNRLGDNMLSVHRGPFMPGAQNEIDELFNGDEVCVWMNDGPWST
jgi:hypothetical protein